MTGRLRSYREAMGEIGNAARQVTIRYENKRDENSHLPFRRCSRAMAGFRQMRSVQQFATAHASVRTPFKHDRSLERRPRFKSLRDEALAE
ncbi:DDE-type integrase/transposase/recombinase [Oceanicaulis sp.]|uniref:DDE-type integrase/transposase/recombinase n=1 Tax=Oceanicaulis sp. TaxID=1924941 RepID=UPI003BAD0362